MSFLLHLSWVELAFSTYLFLDLAEILTGAVIIVIESLVFGLEKDLLPYFQLLGLISPLWGSWKSIP